MDSVEVFCCFAGEDGVVCVRVEDGCYAVGEIAATVHIFLLVLRRLGEGRKGEWSTIE
jgi:hypothetical protein